MRLSRRQFLVTSAAFALAGRSAASQTNGPDIDPFLENKTDLSFFWDKDAGILRVIEAAALGPDELLKLNEEIKIALNAREKDTKKLEALRAVADYQTIWEALPWRFWPDASVKLRNFPDLQQRTSQYDSVGTGPLRARKYELLISGKKKSDTPGKQLKLTFDRDDKRWLVKAESTLWKQGLEFGPTRFDAFVKSGQLVNANIEPAVANATLNEFFGQQFSVQAPVRVALKSDLTWSLSPTLPQSLLCLVDEINCSSISSLGWQLPSEENETAAAEKNLTVSREAFGKRGSEAILEAIGAGSARTGALSLGPTESKFSAHYGDIFHAHVRPSNEVENPIGIEVTRRSQSRESIAKFTASGWQAWFQDGQNNLTSKIPTIGHVECKMRDVVGSDGQSIHIDAFMDCVLPPETQHVTIATRIGQIVTVPQQRKWPKVKKAGQPEDQPDQTKKNAELEGRGDRDFTLRISAGGNYTEGIQRKFKTKLNFAHIALDLLQAETALEGASFSSITFDHAAVSLLYDEDATRALPASYIWLKPQGDPHKLAARLDLTRAEITATRHIDLLSLKFRFADLALLLPVAARPLMMPLPDECRLIRRRGEDDAIDTRALLVVEFPPQHVLEQALFWPNPPGPAEFAPDNPDDLNDTFDVTLKLNIGGSEQDRQKTFSLNPHLLALELFGLSLEDRARVRREWLRQAAKRLAFPETQFVATQDLKSFPLDVSPPNNTKTFLNFAKDYFESARAKLPVDQWYYFGPLGLAPDGMALARGVVADRLDAEVEAMLKQAAESIIESAGIDRAKWAEWKNANAPEDKQLALEATVESGVPLYQLFKAWYRKNNLTSDASDFRLVALDSAEKLTEKLLNADFKGQFQGKSKPLDLLAGRLSRPSRLVFRVNCLPAGAELGRFDEKNKGEAIAFSLTGLTDWSKHELCVVRRAMRLYETLDNGLLDVPERRVASLNESDILAFQGIGKGQFRTAAERMADVAENMRKPPGPFETSIEIPARLVLSPNQAATWHSPRRFNPNVFWPPEADEQREQRESGRGRTVDSTGDTIDFPTELPRERVATYAPLWATTLDTSSAPEVRAVYSPDFRPGIFYNRLWLPPNKQLREDFKRRGLYAWPGNKPPPRGPFAPWHVGPERADDLQPKAYNHFKTFADANGQDISNVPDDADFCGRIEANPKFLDNKWSMPRIIAYLCGREKALGPPSGAANPMDFLSSLDAYDRHELVLLSSAYGLPVQGKRGDNFEMLRDLDQFEPPEGYDLVDSDGDTAIYRPKALGVRELTMTSMGGTLRHDTAFITPAAARHITGERLYDSPSIEHWQHWAVLGRDVFVEVVYKGFLFPLGLRASLVKVTERTFIRYSKDMVKAYLRQRMFIRCGNPLKVFPALQQPNGGRQFPVAELELLTTTSPDIVDPTSITPLKVEPLSFTLSGRIKKPDVAGLMFWPRTALSPAADVMFDFKLDGKAARLPLIFVDNTAVQEVENLTALTEYYNKILTPDYTPDRKADDAPFNPVVHKRNTRFGGQSLTYAEELKPGDCTIETEGWTLKAQGRKSPLSGENDFFEFDSRLQGAEQPPFYPAMEVARLRLKQVERFSGALTPGRLAQYDEHYIENGFPLVQAKSDSLLPAGKAGKNINNLDIYLDFITPVPFGMGEKADRSGGMYSPGSDLVALSRRNGPMGGKPAMMIAKVGMLENWVKDLSYDVPTVKKDIAANDNGETVPATTTPKEDPKKTAVFKQYFSSNAKLLGLIRIDQLIEYLGINATDTALPVMQEVIEYGASAMHEANKAAGSIQDFLRNEVLLPLLKVITELRRRWDDIQVRWNATRSAPNNLLAGAGGTAALKLPSLHDLFPEIGDGLEGLEGAIGEAIKEADAIAFALKLAAVYEAGNRLVKGLSRVAANPIGRVTDAAKKVLNGIEDLVVGEFKGIIQFAKDSGNMKDDIRRNITTRLSAFLETQLKPTAEIPLIDQQYLRAARDAVTSSNVKPATQTLATNLLDELEEFQLLTNELSKPHSIQTLANTLVAMVFDSNGPEQARSFLDALAKYHETNVNDFKGKCEDLLRAIEVELTEKAAWYVEQQEEKILKLYETVMLVNDALEHAKANVESVKAKVGKISNLEFHTAEGIAEFTACVSEAAPLLTENAAADAIRLAILLGKVHALLLALEARSYQRAIAAGLALLESFIGVYGLQDLEKQLQPLDAFYKQFLQAQQTALEAATLGGELAKLKKEAGETQNNIVNAMTALQSVKTEVLETLKNDQNANSIPLIVDKVKDVEMLLGNSDALLARTHSRLGALVLVIEQDTKTILEIKGRVDQVLSNQKFSILNLLDAGNAPILTVRQLRDVARSKQRVIENIVSVLRQTVIDLKNFGEAEKGTLGLLTALATLYKAVDETGVLDKLPELSKTALEKFKTADQLIATRVQSLTIALLQTLSKLMGMVVGSPEAMEALVAHVNAFPFQAADPLRMEMQRLKGDIDGLGSIRRKLAAYEEAVSSYATDPGTPEFKRTLGLWELKLDAAEPSKQLSHLLATPETFRDLLDPVAKIERRLAGLPDVIKSCLLEHVDEATGKLVEQLVAVAVRQMGVWPGLEQGYKALRDKRDQIHTELANAPSALTGRIAAVLITKDIDLPKPTGIGDDLLHADTDLLENLSNAPETWKDNNNKQQLRQFIRNWSNNNSSPQQLAENVEGLVQLVLQGDVFSLIDFAAIRDEMEQKIKQLVPLRATLGYSFGGVFDDKAKKVTSGIFDPLPDTRLDIRTEAKIEFLNPKKPEFVVTGELGPFNIKLIGDFLDAVNIKFHGARFSIRQGSSPKLEVFYNDFEIGKDLEFVQQLQAYLTPQEGSGFFLKPRFAPIGIEAGYGIALPVITMGPVSFANVSLNASVIIPFDGSDTIFRAALSRPEAPFTISVLPYGGSGYFGIEANAEGVIGFDASFEFGGAAAFQFGPLAGIGRLMVGVYIRQTKVMVWVKEGGQEVQKSKRLTEMTGTFYCGGTASIWIFNFGASLYVRLGQRDGNMIGIAVFTFSFSSGIVDFDYSIKVERKENKMGDGACFDRPSRVQYAEATTAPIVGSDGTSGAGTSVPEHFKGIRRINKTKCQSEDWKTYKGYFAEMPEGELL